MNSRFRFKPRPLALMAGGFLVATAIVNAAAAPELMGHRQATAAGHGSDHGIAASPDPRHEPSSESGHPTPPPTARPSTEPTRKPAQETSSKPSTEPSHSPSPDPTSKPSPTSSPSPTPANSPTPSSTQLFADNFQEDTVGAFPDDGWTGGGAGWTIAQDGDSRFLRNATDGDHRLSAGNDAWSDYVVYGTLRSHGGWGGVAARFHDAGNFYGCALIGDQLVLSRTRAGTFTVLAQSKFGGDLRSGTWMSVRLEVKGGHLACATNGGSRPSISAVDSSFASGRLGVVGGGAIDYDNISAFRLS